MSLKLNSSGGGSVTLQEPVTANNQTLTLPDNSGTLISTASTAGVTQSMLAAGVAGNGPAFSAYLSGGNQNVSSNTWVKAQLNSEEFDTASAFDNTTNYRFQPTVAGYYQINGSITPDSSSSFGTGLFVALYKSGSLYRVGSVYNTNAATVSTPTVAAVIYLNGTTDFIELYGQFIGGAGMQFAINNRSTSLSGALVRAA